MPLLPLREKGPRRVTEFANANSVGMRGILVVPFRSSSAEERPLTQTFR